jgi:hypothetical protein
MGLTPGITIELVDTTPYRLRYLLTLTGQSAGAVVLPNAAGASPDLRTDALSAAERGVFGIPVLKAMQVPLDTSPGAPAAAVQARNLLLEGPIHVQITPRRGNPVLVPPGPGVVEWAIDANEGAAAGDPASAGYFVYVLESSAAQGVEGQTAYLDIKLRRTKDDGGIRVLP